MRFKRSTHLSGQFTNIPIHALLVIVLWLYPAVISAADTSGCIFCHTSESILKPMVKPPPIPTGEG